MSLDNSFDQQSASVLFLRFVGVQGAQPPAGVTGDNVSEEYDE